MGVHFHTLPEVGDEAAIFYPDAVSARVFGGRVSKQRSARTAGESAFSSGDL